MPEEILATARFNRKVRWYWLWSGTIVLLVTVVGALLIPVYWIVGLLVTERYLKRLRCVLTPRALKVSKGWLVRVEKTIPLDKITDVGLVEGPLMRAMDLQALSIETAGQTGGVGGALVRLTGIEEARGFRDLILAQRERVVFGGAEAGGDLVATGSPSERLPRGAGEVEGLSVLREIQGTLVRIERVLSERPDQG